MKNICVIIPSLDPDKRLLEVVEGVRKVGFSDIILVDDGSKEENKKFFPKGDDITLLIHKANLGKGAALKTAIKYVMENRHDNVGVVTCDGDGQHMSKDILNVANKMKQTNKFILGVRDFSLPDVPPKSRIGNRLSSLALAICCGSYIKDTQTGLRAIPNKLLLPMSQIYGDRFEYETNVLLNLKSMKAPFEQLKIDTVYLDENKGTHFHPVRDTIKIFSLILKYLASSFAAFLTDIILFSLLNSFTSMGVIISTIIARIISSVVNFTLNKKVVFKSGEKLSKAFIKYYALAIPMMFISAFSVKWLSLLFDIGKNSFIITLLKIFVDIIIFILNYKIQKKWIFKSKHSI